MSEHTVDAVYPDGSDAGVTVYHRVRAIHGGEVSALEREAVLSLYLAPRRAKLFPLTPVRKSVGRPRNPIDLLSALRSAEAEGWAEQDECGDWVVRRKQEQLLFLMGCSKSTLTRRRKDAEYTVRFVGVAQKGSELF